MMDMHIGCTCCVDTWVNNFSLLNNLTVLRAPTMNVIMDDIEIIMKMMLINVLDFILI